MAEKVGLEPTVHLRRNLLSKRSGGGHFAPGPADSRGLQPVAIANSLRSASIIAHSSAPGGAT